MVKKALVLGTGGLRGAYSAGVAATLCRELGSDHFDGIYAASVGVFAGAFYASGQPDTIEETWREHVDGNKLVNYRNAWSGKPVLDLNYLTGLFNDRISYLDIDQIFRKEKDLVFVMTDVASGQVNYSRPDRDTIFDLMKASSCLPLFHPPISINGGAYVDGGLNDPYPYQLAQVEGYEDVTVVSNFSPNHKESFLSRILVGKVLPFFC